MVSVEQLSITYKGNAATGAPENMAVREVSFSLTKGKTCVLLGPSGSGKSSIGLALAGLLPAGTSTSGNIRFSEGESTEDLLEISTTHPVIAWMPQGAQQALSPTRTIHSLLSEAYLFHHPGSSDQAEAYIQELCLNLDLSSDLLKAYPHQLSGGQRQRCLLALALCKQPSLLIADEPTSSLDVMAAARLVDLLQQVQAEQQIAILLITHDLGLCSSLNTETVYLEEGKILQYGEFSQLQTAEPLQSVWQAWNRNTMIPTASATPKPLVEAHEITVKYETRGGIFSRGQRISALRQISFQMEEGEAVGILGESGSGKSTLGKVLCGLLPHEGDITWKDQTSSLASRVQLVLQDSYSSLHPRFTIEKNLSEVLRVHVPASTQAQRKQTAIELLEQVRLDEVYLHRYPSTLSGGERQRVAIARSLAVRPSLLILDESVSSLDAQVQGEVMEVIASIAAGSSLSLLVISHDYRIIRQLCHRVLVLKEGEMIESFPVSALHEDLHPYTKRLLSAQAQH